jgi:hypothetical protein
MIRTRPTPEPPPPPRRLTPSADGTFGSTITDTADGVWTFGASGETQRWMDQGAGSLYCWSGEVLYVKGSDARWYAWYPATATWGLYGDAPPIPEPPPDLSPDGTCAFAIVDTAGNHWTIGPGQETLSNGEHMGGGSGFYYLWSGGVVYVYGVDSQWHQWGSVGWQHYGPEPPVPVTPPTPEPGPIPPSGVMPTRLYRSDQQGLTQMLCLVGTATPIVLYSTTAFALIEQVAHRREAEAIAFLDWCMTQRPLNCVRVLVSCWNMFKLSPEEGRAALPRLLQLAGERGLYVEVVAIADTHRQEGSEYVENYPGYDWSRHVQDVGIICADYTNTLVEIVNEPMQPWQSFSPAQLQSMSEDIPGEVPFTLGAPDGGNDESTDYCSDQASYQTVHADRGRAPWGNVRHIREQQVMSENINQHVWDDEPGKEFTPAQQFAIGGLARICMIADTFHANGVRYATIPTGEELTWFLARKDGWAFVPATEWGTFANYGWTAPNPEPPIANVHFHDEDGRAYSLLIGSDRAYTVLLNARDPVWKAGWTCVRKDERTSRVDGVIECGIYELRR